MELLCMNVAGMTASNTYIHLCFTWHILINRVIYATATNWASFNGFNDYFKYIQSYGEMEKPRLITTFRRLQTLTNGN
jgi:hypothetical protein